jgi:nicotinamidase-related amidase
MGSCPWIGQFFSSYAASDANGVCNVSVERQTPQVVLTAGSATPSIPSPIPVTLDPKTTALLLLDYAFCSNFAGCTTSSLPAAANLLQAARAAGVTVIYTHMPIPSAIANQPGDTTITNDIGPDKFLNTSLASTLSSHGIKTVIIGGVLTNGAVLYTALEASMRGYSVVIPEDATFAQNSYVQSYTLYQLLNGPGTSNPTNSASRQERDAHY